jgi:GDP-L-fucose synthase
MDLQKKKILITGGNGFLGSYVVENLLERGTPAKNISIPRRENLDLRIWSNCQKAVKGQSILIHLAADVHGLTGQTEKPAEILYNNLVMKTHIIEAARQAGLEKVVIIGSITSYPEKLKPPFQEKDFWKGDLEEWSAHYGFAKKISLIQGLAYRKQYGLNVIYLILPNLYGPPKTINRSQESHVIPLFIKKVLEAKKFNKKIVDVWGTGRAEREFLYVSDAAEAIVLALEKYNNPELLNIGPGTVINMRQLLQKISELSDYKGSANWDISKKEGQSKRFLDSSRARKILKFKPKVDFEKGLKKTLEHYESAFK